MESMSHAAIVIVGRSEHVTYSIIKLVVGIIRTIISPPKSVQCRTFGISDCGRGLQRAVYEVSLVVLIKKKEGAVRSEFKQTTILTNMGCREVSMQFLRVAFILGRPGGFRVLVSNIILTFKPVENSQILSCEQHTGQDKQQLSKMLEFIIKIGAEKRRGLNEPSASETRALTCISYGSC
ncbi:hypothetical protein F2Q69_00062900 [Brassica cretica]|uniref:Uncharacterized protein n=1 Tax=Brassica cretica TaxID=69181 RepID=A0A8S9RQ70_BRACR|nr:hypothetical protein F2Q69_00062900 [Brassica cretica]